MKNASPLLNKCIYIYQPASSYQPFPHFSLSPTFSHLTCTASANRSTPRNMAARPSTPNRISFPAAIPRVEPPRSFDATTFLAELLRRTAWLSVLIMFFLLYWMVNEERYGGD
mmetsp:Transcript_2024/g.3184  ORF Transcript_2024/g.3184 Transcript_2024/m.3184 type:complete len:113 (+) Transcript_2024:506-844(+)